MLGAQLDPESLTGGLQRKWDTKTHGYPHSRKPVARRQGQFVGEVVPRAATTTKIDPTKHWEGTHGRDKSLIVQ